jgi:hypothetical protein
MPLKGDLSMTKINTSVRANEQNNSVYPEQCKRAKEMGILMQSSYFPVVEYSGYIRRASTLC